MADDEQQPAHQKRREGKGKMKVWCSLWARHVQLVKQRLHHDTRPWSDCLMAMMGKSEHTRREGRERENMKVWCSL
jgi:hypothetical protein